MTQIGEGVTIAVTKNIEEECWFCKEPPKEGSLKNSEVADPDTSDSETETSVP